MTDKVTIVVFEDNQEHLRLLETALRERYQLVMVSNVSEYFTKEQSKIPGLVFISMDYTNPRGFELFEELEEHFEGFVPVIFLATISTNQHRIEVYEKGGVDLINLPTSTNEIQDRVETALNYALSRKLLEASAKQSQSMAMMLISNMGEFSIVLQFMKNCFACYSYVDLASYLLDALHSYDLECCIYFHGTPTPCELSSSGLVQPIERELMVKLKDSGKIRAYKQRLILNESHLTILVKNMPIEDSEKAGRFRDHLAMLLDGAEEKIKTLLKEDILLQQANNIREAMDEIKKDFLSYEKKMVGNINTLLDHFNNALTTLGLTESQEEYLVELLNERMQELVMLYSDATKIEGHFDKLVQDISEVIAKEK